MSDNVILNANTPSQVTVRATNTAGVYTPHSYAELWVANNPVTNTNQIPIVLLLANGVPVVPGSNALGVVENNSANIAFLVANVAVQVANVASLIAPGSSTVKILLANGASVGPTTNSFPVVENNSANIAAQIALGTIQVANVAAQVALEIIQVSNVGVQAANTALQVYNSSLQTLNVAFQTLNVATTISANQMRRVLLSNGSLITVGSNALPTTLQNSSTVSVSHDVSVVFSGANTVLTPKYAWINTATTNTLIVANTGTGIRVLSAHLTVGGGMTLQLASGNTGNIKHTSYLVNGAIAQLNYNPHGHFITSNNDALVLVLSNANNVGGSIVYVTG